MACCCRRGCDDGPAQPLVPGAEPHSTGLSGGRRSACPMPHLHCPRRRAQRDFSPFAPPRSIEVVPPRYCAASDCCRSWLDLSRIIVASFMPSSSNRENSRGGIGRPK